jgi:hypothetical protein
MGKICVSTSKRVSGANVGVIFWEVCIKIRRERGGVLTSFRERRRTFNFQVDAIDACLRSEIKRAVVSVAPLHVNRSANSQSVTAEAFSHPLTPTSSRGRPRNAVAIDSCRERVYLLRPQKSQYLLMFYIKTSA